MPPSRSYSTASREASGKLSEATDGACVTVHATANAPSTPAAALRYLGDGGRCGMTFAITARCRAPFSSVLDCAAMTSPPPDASIG